MFPDFSFDDVLCKQSRIFYLLAHNSVPRINEENCNLSVIDLPSTYVVKSISATFELCSVSFTIQFPESCKSLLEVVFRKSFPNSVETVNPLKLEKMQLIFARSPNPFVFWLFRRVTGFMHRPKNSNYGNDQKDRSLQNKRLNG